MGLRHETQHVVLNFAEMLGFVPQPNLRLHYGLFIKLTLTIEISNLQGLVLRWVTDVEFQHCNHYQMENLNCSIYSLQ